MGKLIRNLLVMDKREKSCFLNDYQDFDLVKAIELISEFVSELISYGLIWNCEKNSRDILMTALDFYEVVRYLIIFISLLFN